MNFVPNTDSQQERLLARIGAKSAEDLFADIPKEVRLQRPLGYSWRDGGAGIGQTRQRVGKS